MRTLLEVTFPHEPFNSLVREGTASAKMKKILEALKPESAYFTEINGKRCGLIVVDLAEAWQIPSLAEPWFMTFAADVKIRPVMKPEDLERADLAGLGKKWG